MNLGALLNRTWKVTLTGALRVLLAAAPCVWVGSVCLGSLPETDGVKLAQASWREMWSAILPSPGALLAGALLLLPFALSTLRLRRRS